MKAPDLTGSRFGKLTVQERAGSTAQQKALWRCRCDCGGEAVTTTGALRFGKTRSCGCLQRTSSKRFGPLRRQINYADLKCHICGEDISGRFMASDGTVLEHLTHKRIEAIACEQCRIKLSRQHGEVSSQRNFAIDFTEVYEQVVLGSILGDGSIERSPLPPSYTGARHGLAIKHGLKQRKYLLWKASLLGEILSNVDYPPDRIRLRTKKHPRISQIHVGLSDGNGHKLISYEGLSHLGALGFAIWYLDDGNLLPNRIGKKGEKRKAEIRFSTCSFSEAENLILRQLLLEKVKVESTKCQWVQRYQFGKELPEPKRFFGIRLSGDNAERFLEFIRLVVDWKTCGMAYKQDTTLRGPLDNKHTRRRSSADRTGAPVP